MLNIAPQQQKILIRKEYIIRRAILCLALVSVVLLIAFVLLVPSYFVSYGKIDALTQELERSKQILNNGLQPKEITAELATALSNAEYFKPFKTPQSPYALVRIFENKPATIKISSISFVNDSKGQSTIGVSGTARDRESLTAFARSLEGRAEFSSVDLPVSNFVKESNIDFSMKITVK